MMLHLCCAHNFPIQYKPQTINPIVVGKEKSLVIWLVAFLVRIINKMYTINPNSKAVEVTSNIRDQ